MIDGLVAMPLMQRFAGSRGLRHGWWVLGILALAFALRLGLALSVPSIARPDEVFQNLEPAHRLLTGWGVITWEWRDGIRSWLLPGLVAGLMSLAPTPHAGLTVVAAGLSLVSLGVVAAGMVFGWRYRGAPGAALVGLCCAVWPDLVHYGPKALSEIQGGNALVIGTMLAALTADRRPPRRVTILALATGLALGAALCLRFQLLPGIAVAALWAGRADLRGRWLPMVCGGLVPVALLGITDTIAWGLPFHSIWRNYAINVMEGRAAQFGVSPFYGYAGKAVLVWGAGVVSFAVLFCLGLRHAMLPGLTAAAVILSHSLIGHKEYSFIYAGVALAVIVAGLGLVDAVRRIAAGSMGRWSEHQVALPAIGLWTLVALTVAVTTFAEPLRRNTNHLLALSAVRARADLCGLGYGPGVPWYETGGYSYLDRPVPITLLPNTEAIARATPAANYVLATQANLERLPSYEKEACWDGLCLLRRPGGCMPVPALQINQSLLESGP